MPADPCDACVTWNVCTNSTGFGNYALQGASASAANKVCQTYTSVLKSGRCLSSCGLLVQVSQELHLMSVAAAASAALTHWVH